MNSRPEAVDFCLRQFGRIIFMNSKPCRPNTNFLYLPAVFCLLLIGLFCPLKAEAATKTTVYKGVDYARVYSFDDYMKYNPSLKAALGKSPAAAVKHFATTGVKNGLRGKSSFDVRSYIYGNAGLRHLYKNNLPKYYYHYMKYGWKEASRKGTYTGVTRMKGYSVTYRGINYSSVYDYNDYVARYPGIKKTFGYDDEAVLKHFAVWGMQQGKIGKSSFTAAEARTKGNALLAGQLPKILAGSTTGKKTDSIIVVTGHTLQLYLKTNGTWQKKLSAYCGYGRNGFKSAASRKEGDGTTPYGSFPILMAFGRGDRQGTSLTYRAITSKSYWSGEKATYNQWVESSKKIAGEHLIDYSVYRYALAVGFNRNPVVWGRGSAIFVHCKGSTWATSGCISVEESVMKQLFRLCRKNTYIIMVPEESYLSMY